MRQLVLTSIAGMMAVLLLAGCQESQSSQIQRARLVGRENLQLKKQLEAKNAEITRLQDEIQHLQTAQNKAAQQAGDTNIKAMQIVAETEMKNKQLQKENEALKAQLEKLKTQ